MNGQISSFGIRPLIRRPFLCILMLLVRPDPAGQALPNPPPQARDLRPATSAAVVPEFGALSLLLGSSQGVTLGSAVTNDVRGPSLLHFQQFQEAGNPAVNSVEMHSDGSVYIAVTPSHAPLWYDTYVASEADDTKDNLIAAAQKATVWEVALSTGARFDPNPLG